MAGKLSQILASVQSGSICVEEAHSDIMALSLLGDWYKVEDKAPEEYEPIIGLELPWEAKYVCHREGDVYISDETGDDVGITQWRYFPEWCPF